MYDPRCEPRYDLRYDPGSGILLIVLIVVDYFSIAYVHRIMERCRCKTKNIPNIESIVACGHVIPEQLIQPCICS